ncbi:hypothetical protein IIC38_01770 [candidate division KSB1 bacterium]|nr:hypothetical protein [candidate division KSB1 bacterium]
MAQNLSRISELQIEISSGKKLNKPSDDASGVPIVLGIYSKIERNNQYIRNIDDGLSRFGLTENTLNDVSNLINRAKDLAIFGASDGLNNQDRQIAAVEVNQLIEHLFSLSNKDSVEGYLFGGTKTDSVPFVAIRDNQNRITRVLADGNISSAVNRSIGDNDVTEISSDYNGIFYGNENVFETLIQLRDGLEKNDKNQIRDSMEKLNRDHFRAIVSKIGEIGVKVKYFIDRKNEIKNDFVTLSEQLSSLEDTDIAESIILLELHLVAYQAALLAGSKIIETTLTSILK